MEETISLQELFKVLKKRFWLILLLMSLGLGIAGAYSIYFITPTYQANTQILVNKKEDSLNLVPNQQSPQDIQTNIQLINTYKLIIKSPAILSIVIDRLDLDIRPSALAANVDVSSAQDSQMINVSVKDTENYRAVDIANVTAEVFQEEVVKLMNVNNVNILSPAEHSEDPVPINPNIPLNMAIASVVGLMLGVGLAFLLEYLDNTLKSESDIEDVLELPVLGLISSFPEEEQEQKSIIRSFRKKEGQTNV